MKSDISSTSFATGTWALALGISAASMSSGCVRTTDDFARENLNRLNRGDDMVLVGSVHIVVNGIDRTEHTSFETDGPSGSFQLSASGAVIWVVSQHQSDETIHLSWLARPYGEDALGFGERVVLARADPSGDEHCWYFGKVTVRVTITKEDERGGAIVGWARPQAFITQVEDEVAHRAELARRYPALSGLTCTAAKSNTAVTFP